MSNLFLKFGKKGKKEDIFHSSAYGIAQNGASIGSASAQSFSERQKIEQNRQKIASYRDSRVVNDALLGAPKPKTYTDATSASANSTAVGSASGLDQSPISRNNSATTSQNTTPVSNNSVAEARARFSSGSLGGKPAAAPSKPNPSRPNFKPNFGTTKK